jgi:hypothetical protein
VLATAFVQLENRATHQLPALQPLGLAGMSYVAFQPVIRHQLLIYRKFG